MTLLGAGPPRTIRAVCGGKVNVGWRVGPKREDGYHEVSGLLQTISLSDSLTVRVHDTDDEVAGSTVRTLGDTVVGLEVTGAEAESLEPSSNLVLDAAAALADRVAPRPTSLALAKDIPVAAGLGGGSADAAAALLALSHAWGAPITLGELVRLAGVVSSDAPAILVGGLVHASGRGEVIRRVGCISGTAFVLGFVDARLGAAEVYGAFDRLDPHPDQSRIEANDLEAAAAELCPAVGRGLDAMRDAGATVVFVSGSGPTVVAVCADHREAEAVGGRAAAAFRRLELCHPTPWGVRLVIGGDE